ncbi:MAG: class I SAM-dependent methyltransferase [Pseudohongiellaceae bacterium]
MTTGDVIIVSRGEQADAVERALQQELGLPLLAPQQSVHAEFFLRFEQGRLTLYRHGEKTTGVTVDFSSPALTRRRRQGLKSQGLGKAVGLKGARRPRVLDATAGLGTDAFLLASHGCRVLTFERVPVVAALLRDAMRRAAAHAELAPVMERLELRSEDVRQATLTGLDFDVVYLDPMFPPRRKSARVKKGMSALQRLLGESELLPGENEENAGLMALARGIALRRVVVKRGRHSPYLEAQEPDLQFSGRSNRYDVYFTHRANAADAQED